MKRLFFLCLTLLLLVGCGSQEGKPAWIGVYALDRGEYNFHFGETTDKTTAVGIIKVEDDTDLAKEANTILQNVEKTIEEYGTFMVNSGHSYNLELNGFHTHHALVIEEPGRYAFVTERDPADNGFGVYTLFHQPLGPVEAYLVD